MDTLNLKVITPKKIAVDEQVLSVSMPAAAGEITILPHHTHLFSLLTEGIIKIRRKDTEDYLAIGGGYVETDGTEVNILVSRAYNQNEIDQNLIQEAMGKANKILAESKDRKERFEATSMLRRSMVEMKLLKKRRAPKPYAPTV